jgi:integrase
MGTVYARGKKLWIGFNRGDKYVYKATGYVIGQELLAKKALAELEAMVAAGEYRAPGKSFGEYATEWAQRRIEKARHTNAKLDASAVARHIVGAVLDVAGRRVVFGDLELREVRLQHIRAFLEHLELKNTGTLKQPDHLAPRTRRSLYSLVNRIFAEAERAELVTKSPCQLERNEWPQLVDKDISWRAGAVFTLPELERLVSDARVPLDRRVFYAIAFLCSGREGEIAALRWSAYDLSRQPLGALLVHASFTRRNKREKSPKNKLARELPVHPVAASLLAEWRLSGWASLFGRQPKPEDLLVPNRAGAYVTDLNISDNWGRDLARLGLRHRRFHDARRTFVSLARAGGAGGLLRWVSHGPSKSEMQDVYTTPPWEALCREVLCIKAQLRGEASLLPLAASVRGRTVAASGPAGHGSTSNSTTQRGVAMEASNTTQKNSAQGEIRTRTEPASSVRRDLDPAASVARIDGSGRSTTADCSNSTTARRPRPAFLGGMRIAEDEPDPHPASSTAGVRRG